MRTTNAFAFLSLSVLFASGCTVTQQVADTQFRPPSGQYRVIVMQPAISVGVLTAGGMVEPRQDWTDQARANVLTALNQQQLQRGGDITIAKSQAEAGGNPDEVADLVFLHNVVGEAIKTHKYAGLALPTKSGKFDWTLGTEAVEYGHQTRYDYALFVRAADSFSSGGRVALQAIAMVGCAFGVCAMPTGGQQFAYASLVDLRTGQVVWFNTLASSVGDIRTAEGAKKMVDGLLSTMKPGRATGTNKT